MDDVDRFIARYTKEYDFYSQVGRIVSQRLEAALKAEGVRAIVTYRAKDVTRLKEKCRQRESERGGYSSADAIFDDIVDLVGVRVALYFPAESEQVDRIIKRMFRLVAPQKSFPDPAKRRAGQRFSGYSAEHYRVCIRERDLGEDEVRYSIARAEIQVASVLMHAWAEVEHDLVYKPSEDSLSPAEYALLDQLNGIVLTGEMSLEALQKERESRVAVGEARIRNHYDLASLLAEQAKQLTGGPVSDAGMGRVDILFELLERLKLNTPGELRPYFDALHGNIEIRPLAEQIIDELLAEDASRYDIYDSVLPEGHSFATGGMADGSDAEAFGHFMKAWIELEQLARAQGLKAGKPFPPNSISYYLHDLGLADAESLDDLDTLRRMRNNLVHGIDTPPTDVLMRAAAQLNDLIAKIRDLDRPDERVE